MQSQTISNLGIIKEFTTPQTDEAIAVCIFQDEEYALENTGILRQTILRILTDEDFKAEQFTAKFVRVSDENGELRRILLVGSGKKADFHTRRLKQTVAFAVRQAKAEKVKKLNFVLPEVSPANVQTAIEGAISGVYETNFYRAEEESETKIESLTLICADFDDEISAAIERGRIIGETTNWTRALADEPGNKLPPREFARRASEAAAEFGIEVEIFDQAEIKRRGMGGLAGVGQGSNEPPFLIVLKYEPQAVESDEIFALVGKGITFDTGGIGIKPPLGMDQMKSDMTGGAVALGALLAIARLGIKKRVIAVVPTAENMPNGNALKPGDIITTLAGLTVEVTDTDAEGRLILTDGIAYAKELGATKIVDLATLTGSIIIALGDLRCGLFSNNDDWANTVLAAFESAGELAWRMPIDEEFGKNIKSEIADYKNYGRSPDASSAALLLGKFAAETPWCHLDIAGTAWFTEAQPFAPAGCSGNGVRMLVELVS